MRVTNKNAVYALVAQGKLDAYSILNRSNRIPESSVRAYLESCKVDPEEVGWDGPGTSG